MIPDIFQNCPHVAEKLRGGPFLASVLIVDDIDINRIILREILQDDYDILEADNGQSALDILFTQSPLPDAMLLDIMMPGMDGFEVLEAMKAHARTEKVPVLFITAADASVNESRGLKEGASDYISKPFNPDVVKARVDNHIQLKRYRDHLEELLEKKIAELVAVHENTLETLATIIEYRDLESGTHIRRSSELTRALVLTMLNHEDYRAQLVAQQYSSIINAVKLHDIGKVGIPDKVLLKPGALTDEEFEIIKTHTTIGANIIDAISTDGDSDTLYLKHCRDICKHHHERWDGKGYPSRLKGLDIPLSARIVAIVDVYDALVNKRCYKPPFTYEQAKNIIVDGRGTHFDPDIVDIFLTVADKFQELEMRYSDDEQEQTLSEDE